MKTWQERLVEVREARDLSQREVAEMAGMSQPGYGLIERGERNPTVDTMLGIAEALGFSSLASLCKRIEL